MLPRNIAFGMVQSFVSDLQDAEKSLFSRAQGEGSPLPKFTFSTLL
jgi:hypothetical protein